MGRQLVEESMLQSKAELMAQNIDLGTINQVKEQLALLSQFKASFVKVWDRMTGGEKRNRIRTSITFSLSYHSRRSGV